MSRWSVVASRSSSLCAVALLCWTAAGCEPTPAPAEPEPLPPLDLLEGCNPLLTDLDCTLPYPSDFFRSVDDAMPSGHRVALDGEGRVFTGAGDSATVTDRALYDGFSRTPTISFILGDVIEPSQVVGIHDDYDLSTAATHGVVLLHVDSGTLVPHFVDFDARAEDEVRTMVQVRPLVQLEEDARYVVAVQGLTNPNGDVIDAPEGFRRLRDGVAGDDASYAGLNERYGADVFAPLEAAGVDVGGLQLAWDFTTGTDVHAMNDMLTMREQLVAHLEANGVEVTIDVVNDNPDHDRIFRTIFGTIAVPLYMEHAQAGAELLRDADGQVTSMGTMDVAFTAQVPRSVADKFTASMPLQFGHGFFGEQVESQAGSTQNIFAQTETVSFAIDWIGMSSEDMGTVVGHLGGSEAWKGLTFTDRVVQAVANGIALSWAIQNVMPTLEAFQRPADGVGVVEDPQNAGVTNAGESFLDGGQVNFLGISMGHILGGVLVALNPYVDHAVFQVGGAGFTHMMSRAAPFEGFLFVLDVSIPDPFEKQKFATSLQRGFDRIDPALYAAYIAQKPLPFGLDAAVRDRKVLMQVGVNDTSVPNFTSLLHARALRLPRVGDSTLATWGLDEASSTTSSGVSVFDYGQDGSFTSEAKPPETTNATHDSVRRTPEALAQMKTFLETGEVVAPCVGPCELAVP